MRILRAAAIVAAIAVGIVGTPAVSQTPLPNCRNANGAYFPCGGSVAVDKNGNAIDASNPLPTSPGPLSPASATPLAGTVTNSAVTPTKGAATFASGIATIGPFTPALGRDIGLKLWTTNSAAYSCQMFNSIDAGATKLPLTIFDTPVGGPYTAPVNSVITSESIAGTTDYLICSVSSGTLSYWLGN